MTLQMLLAGAAYAVVAAFVAYLFYLGMRK
jgi:hypothetical protein